MHNLLPYSRPFLAGQNKRMKGYNSVKKENKSERVYSEKGGMKVEAGTVSSILLEERNLNPAVFSRWEKTSVPLSCIP
jgi:hypothetical protein